MYSSINFKTKKQLKEAVKDGKKIAIFQPNQIFEMEETKNDYTGIAFLEGPWYPAPHRWYAKVEMRDGYVVKVS
jgi:hypothetical protein